MAFFNQIRTLSSPQGAWLEVDGKKVLNFCSKQLPWISQRSAHGQKPLRMPSPVTVSARAQCAPSPARWTCMSSWKNAWAAFKQGRSCHYLPIWLFAPTWAPSRHWSAKGDVIFSDELKPCQHHRRLPACPAPASSATHTAIRPIWSWSSRKTKALTTAP